MIRITAKPDDTIEDIVKGLINEAVENSSCPRIIADFTDKGNLNSSFWNIGHSEGEVYDISFAVEAKSKIKEFIIQVNYLVSKGQGELVGKYTSQDNQDIGKERLSEIIKYPPLPEPVEVRLEEVGFAPPGKKRELLYWERYHKDRDIHSKFGVFINNMEDNVSRIIHSCSSNETHMRRQFSSSTTYWIVWTPINMAITVVGGVISGIATYLICNHYFK